MHLYLSIFDPSNSLFETGAGLRADTSLVDRMVVYVDPRAADDTMMYLMPSGTLVTADKVEPGHIIQVVRISGEEATVIFHREARSSTVLAVAKGDKVWWVRDDSATNRAEDMGSDGAREIDDTHIDSAPGLVAQ